MKYLFIFLTILSSVACAQQINPVPDYIFRNQMSVGRNGSTDTAAYISIGPRFGGNKGLQPPMVSDTNTVSSTKRNGLLIFSKQLNNYAFWDSARGKWRQFSEATGSVSSVGSGFGILGGPITSTGTLRVDSASVSTRARLQKVADSISALISSGGLGTVTSVASGYGTSFSTITNAGTVTVDSNVIASRARLKKGIDSLGAAKQNRFVVTTTGTSGSSTYSNDTLNIPTYSLSGLGGVPTSRTLTINGTTSDLSANRTFNVGTITSVSSGVGLSGGPITLSGTLSADTLLLSTKAWRQKGVDSVISAISNSGGGTVLSVSAGTGMSFSTITSTGSVSADTLTLSTKSNRQKGLDSLSAIKQNNLSLTTTGNSGSSTLVNSALNIPNYTLAGLGGITSSRQITINGTTQDLSQDRTFNVGTVTSAGIIIGSSGNNLSVTNSPITASGNITLNIPNASATARGVLTSADWIAFNNKLSSIDTNMLSTKAWRQKGDDSLGMAIVGKVNISDTSTMLGAYLRKADTAAMLTPYVRKVDTSTMLSPYVRAAGYGLTKGTQNLSVDSALMATRARVQKSIDSVASIVAAPDSLLFSTRAWRQKGDDSLNNLIGARVGFSDTATMLTPYVRGSGTTNYIPVWSNQTRTLANSIASSVISGGGNTVTFNIGETSTANTELRLRSLSNSGQSALIFSQGLFIYSGIPTSSLPSEIYYNQSGLKIRESSNKFYINFPSSSLSSNNFIQTSNLRVNAVGPAGTGGLQVIGSGTFSSSDSFVPDTLTRIFNYGRTRLFTVDSISSAINMLTIGNDGIVRKAAVPSGGGGGGVTSVSAGTGMNFSTITTTGSVSADTIILSTRARTKKQIDSVAALVSGVTMSEGTVTIESGWNFSRPTASSGATSQVVKMTDGSLTTVFVNIAVHKTTTTFTEDAWIKVGTIPSGYRPNNVIMGQLPTLVSGDQFRSQSNVSFTGDMKTSGHMAFRIQEDGDIEINVDQVTSSVDLSGANYVLFPIVVTYPIIAIIN